MCVRSENIIAVLHEVDQNINSPIHWRSHPLCEQCLNAYNKLQKELHSLSEKNKEKLRKKYKPYSRNKIAAANLCEHPNAILEVKPIN